MLPVSQRAAIPAASSHNDPTQDSQTWHHPGGKLVELGAHSLTQAELLAILIGAGVQGRPALAIANAVLDQYVGLFGIHRQATLEDLARIPGLGQRKAARILAAIELGRRLHHVMALPKTRSESASDLFSSLPHAVAPDSRKEGPSDADLLATIIGSGIQGRSPRVIAHDLLARFGSLTELFNQDMGDFLHVKGLNSVKTIRIAAALEITKRLAQAI